MQSSYWTNFARQRVSRRRALAATGFTAFGAALLAACGGGDKGGGEATSNLIAKPADTSKEAKRGGSYKTSITTDAGSWDPYLRGAWFGTLGAVMFSRLTIVKPGAGEASTGEVGGDLAQSWEFSPDGLTASFKLRPNGHFSPQPPVNGRAVDAQDVVASWNRWKGISGTRATVDNTASPDAPVMSVSAPDNQTVTMKLAFPAVTLPSLISASVGQAFHILPKEADAGYNARNLPIGSGPFYLSEHVPSARMTFKRNTGYHEADRPYFDVVEYPVITEYATGFAAFKSGQLYTYAVRPDDTLGVKHDVPDLTMYQSALTPPTAHMFFGYKAGPKGMFRDKRLRQAFSMAVDRELFAETWYNISKFTSQGLPVRTAWSSAVPADEFTGWWLDPQSKEFGPNAKYYQHNLTEAKKLLAAAGFANGVEYVATRAGGNYGPEYDRQIEITEGMASEAGFRPTANVVNYQNVLIPQYQEVRGEFEGVGWMLRPQSSSDPVDKFAEYMFSGSGPNFIGFDPDGKGDHSGDPFVEDLIRKSRTERDMNKRKQYLYDMQKHMGEQMYIVRSLAGATAFDLAWPVLKNYNYFRGARRSEELSYFWLDETQKPLGKA